MAHIDVHQRGARKEMVRLGRDYRNAMITTLADMPCSSNTSNAIAYNYDMFWVITQVVCSNERGTLIFVCLPTDLRSYILLTKYELKFAYDYSVFI